MNSRAVSATSVVATLLLGCLIAPPVAAVAGCQRGDAAWIWAAPLQPQPGEAVTIVGVAVSNVLDEIRVTAPDGERIDLATTPGGGPPWSRYGVLPAPKGGSYRIEALHDGKRQACAELDVGGASGDRGSGAWDIASEALYAAWIEHLFDAPADEAMGFPSLAPVLADPARNFLHGYLGNDEDDGLTATPDCADLSYYLRAYFAWKRGLPLAYRPCSRGSGERPPRCTAPTLERAFVGPPRSAATFRAVSRRLMDTVHSGSGRTALDDDVTDLYPVPLERASLWPGTVYADPYGHTLVLVKWVAQTATTSGLLFAVDAQPDNSIGRKRFWEGTFLFDRTPSAGPGFKTHRPVATVSGELDVLPNVALAGEDGKPRYSVEQATLTQADFYAGMERLVNPDGLAPEAAYEAALAALMEQIQTRIDSVDNGEAYVRAHPGVIVAMPRGSAIFETSGPWEDYSTPSRDMRLLIALRVLEALPERIRRYPALFVLGAENPAAAATRIEALHASRIAERFVTYTRSDGSPWRLSLADIYARRSGFEVAYNPNDCVERRWGAMPESADHATCRRQAPSTQQAQMEKYRPWFRDARRPPR